MKICKYRRKPIVVRAYRTYERVIVNTLEGDMLAEPGDYIIIGINGEKWPCKPDIFQQTYWPID